MSNSASARSLRPNITLSVAKTNRQKTALGSQPSTSLSLVAGKALIPSPDRTTGQWLIVLEPFNG